MAKLAETTPADKVVCKMSGLWTEAPKGQPVEVVRPWCEALLAIWGPERLLWGSDWPVLELAGSYSDWWQASRRLSASLSEAGRQALYGGTARPVYML